MCRVSRSDDVGVTVGRGRWLRIVLGYFRRYFDIEIVQTRGRKVLEVCLILTCRRPLSVFTCARLLQHCKTIDDHATCSIEMCSGVGNTAKVRLSGVIVKLK